MAKRLGARLALLVACSRWVADHMIAGGVSPHNVCVMYDGLDAGAIVPQRPADVVRKEWDVTPDAPVIGIVGNIREWKGQDIVVRALADVVAAHPGVVCFFVGSASTSAQDAAFDAELRRLVREGGLEPHVRFTGYQKEPASFVRMLDLVIHASRDPEPFGMVALEAMAQRKALIASAAGGIDGDRRRRRDGLPVPAW